MSQEDILKVLTLAKVEFLQYKTHYIHQYVKEVSLFKVNLSTYIRRSHVLLLKRSKKEISNLASVVSSKRPIGEHVSTLLKKKKKVVDRQFILHYTRGELSLSKISIP